MGNHADRMRDLIAEAALEPGTERIAADFERAFMAITNVGALVRSFYEGAEERMGDLWQDNADLRDEVHALSNRLEGVTQAMATRADLEDAKVELREVIAEATATPFDPERPA